jgi:hypothetical protein
VNKGVLKHHLGGRRFIKALLRIGMVMNAINAEDGIRVIADDVIEFY